MYTHSHAPIIVFRCFVLIFTQFNHNKESSEKEKHKSSMEKKKQQQQHYTFGSDSLLNGCDFIDGVVFLYCEMFHADICSHILHKEYIIDYWSWHACYWLSPVSQPSPINHFYNSKITTIAVIVYFFRFFPVTVVDFNSANNSKTLNWMWTINKYDMTTGNKCKYLWTKSEKWKKKSTEIIFINQ